MIAFRVGMFSSFSVYILLFFILGASFERVFLRWSGFTTLCFVTFEAAEEASFARAGVEKVDVTEVPYLVGFLTPAFRFVGAIGAILCDLLVLSQRLLEYEDSPIEVNLDAVSALDDDLAHRSFTFQLSPPGYTTTTL